jgi:hypothetical protein
MKLVYFRYLAFETSFICSFKLEKRGNRSKRMLRFQIEKRNKTIIVYMHVVYLMINLWPECSRKGRE